jgi:hypothetical protein
MVNDALWKSGAKKPLARIRVKAAISEDGIVNGRLPEETTIEEEKKKFADKKKGDVKDSGTKIEEGKVEGKEKPDMPDIKDSTEEKTTAKQENEEGKAAEEKKDEKSK